MSELEFGRYEPLFRIAAGGMAEVHAARIRGEAGFEKLVAVKRMLPHLTDDPEFVAMFLDEGRLAANIHSPHVVSTIDLGRAEDGSLYIVMDLVVGIALSTMIRAAVKQKRLLPVAEACEIIAQAATGLDDAHEARTPTGVHLGIVHRDVSPQNVLVGADGRTRVVDFGVARAVLRQSHTSTGTLKGKFGYFSPEQAAARDLDRRSDVFALGVVAWETLLGRRLFESDNPLETITRVRSMTIPRPTEMRPDVPEAVSAAVMRALERDPAQRWESAGAFAMALRAAVGKPVSARDVAALVNDIGGAAIREMQGRIEAAMAGDHLKTKALRTPARGSEEPGQATPSGMPARVADLPTLVRTAPVEPSAIATPEPVRPASASRWWIAGLALSAVLAVVLIGIAMVSQSTPPEPVATPLATPIVHLAPVATPTDTTTSSVTPEAPPPETSIPAPTTDRGTRAPVDRGTRPPRSTTVARTVDPPPPSTRVAPPPPSTVAAPPPATRVTSAPPPPTTRATPPPTTAGTRHPAGLAGDDAFDQGI